jgi:hypothetical protein
MQGKHRDQDRVLETPKEIRCDTRKKNYSPGGTEACDPKVRGEGLLQ